MRESDIEATLVARIKALGGECRKVKWIGRNGAPDQLVMLPGADPALREPSALAARAPSAVKWLHETQQRVHGACVWVELKAPGEKPRPSQTREHERLRALGQTVLVIDSLELIDKHFPLN